MQVSQKIRRHLQFLAVTYMKHVGTIREGQYETIDREPLEIVIRNEGLTEYGERKNLPRIFDCWVKVGATSYQLRGIIVSGGDKKAEYKVDIV